MPATAIKWCTLRAIFTSNSRKITSEGNQQGGSQQKGTLKLGEDNLEPVEVADNKIAPMKVEDIQRWGHMADQGVTFAGQEALSLAVGQIYHPVCPFRSCVVSEVQI
ncbi:Hypothetical predicted protein [Olea europaea subsp. europaea]|nr:Hypothetical predicted protein [Olea europaea subsp. europaea]